MHTLISSQPKPLNDEKKDEILHKDSLYNVVSLSLLTFCGWKVIGDASLEYRHKNR